MLLEEQVTPGAFLSTACTRKETESILISISFSSWQGLAQMLGYEGSESQRAVVSGGPWLRQDY